jgi:Conjugative transposon protein TcpC
MVRGSGVDDAAQPAGYANGTRMDAGIPGQPGGRSRPARSWNGGGGRWLVWTLRAVLWIVLLIIGYRGITAIIFNETPASRSGSSAPASGGTGTSQFPATLAEAYAMQFGAVYLNFSTATAGQRSQELAAYVPGALISVDPQLGWDGSGSLQLDSEQVAGISVQDATQAVVTLLASVNGRLMQLGVPIYAANGGLVVSGEPAWLAAPPQAAPPSPPAAASDPAATSALNAQLPAFFQAYGSGDSATLNRFLAPGATVSGLGGAVAYTGISNLYVPAGGATRDITATVVWQLAGSGGSGPAKLEMTYDLTVIDQGGKWYVQDIAASTRVSQPTGGA